MVGMWIFKGLGGGKPCLGVCPSTPAPSSPLNIHILALESRCEVRCNMPFQFPYVLLMFGLARPSTLRAPSAEEKGAQYIIVKVLQWTFEKTFLVPGIWYRDPGIGWFMWPYKSLYTRVTMSYFRVPAIIFSKVCFNSFTMRYCTPYIINEGARHVLGRASPNISKTYGNSTRFKIPSVLSSDLPILSEKWS